MGLFLQLFTEFFKIGLFASGAAWHHPLPGQTGHRHRMVHGNGPAEHDCHIRIHPGPSGQQCHCRSYHIAGFPGALDATLGLITPSVIIIIIVSQFLKKFGNSKYVKAVMYGLRAASAGLIAAAGLMVARVTLLHPEAGKPGTWPGSPMSVPFSWPWCWCSSQENTKKSTPSPSWPLRRGGGGVRVCGIRKRGCEKFTPPVNGQLSAVNDPRKPAKLALNNGNSCINRSRRGGRPGRPQNAWAFSGLADCPYASPTPLFSKFLFSHTPETSSGPGTPGPGWGEPYPVPAGLQWQRAALSPCRSSGGC